MTPKSQTLLVIHSEAALLDRERPNLCLSRSKDGITPILVRISSSGETTVDLERIWSEASFVFIVGNADFAKWAFRLHEQLSLRVAARLVKTYPQLKGNENLRDTALRKPFHIMSFQRLNRILENGLRHDPVHRRYSLRIPMSVEERRYRIAKAQPARTNMGRVLRKARKKRASNAKKAYTYKVWYATNREVDRLKDPEKAFSGRRGTTIFYGCCKVTLPKSRRIGSTGTNWLRRILRGEFQDDHIRIRTLRQIKDDAYWSEIGNALKPWKVGDRTCLAFVHGYNVSWRDSVVRAAQLGFDLKIPLTALFSWPSLGVTAGYPVDEGTIASSEWAIETFLSRLAVIPEIDRVHLVAHSMGNRGMLRALERIATRAQVSAKIPFGQIILASPDVDKSEFENIAIAHRKLCERTTTYVCSKDKALKASEIFHGGYDRAGYSPPITVVPNIDTIDASHVSFSWLGHSEYAIARDVLKDMFALIHDGKSPDKRHGISARTNADGAAYWAFDLVNR